MGTNLVADVIAEQLPKVQVSHIPERSFGKKVVLYKTDQALYLALGKGLSGLQSLVWNPIVSIVGLPDRLAVLVQPDAHTLHIVGENIPGNAHVLEGMDHANEQVLLFGIEKELHILFTAMVADHSKAGG